MVLQKHLILTNPFNFDVYKINVEYKNCCGAFTVSVFFSEKYQEIVTKCLTHRKSLLEAYFGFIFSIFNSTAYNNK